jgi:hypothetical protein
MLTTRSKTIRTTITVTLDAATWHAYRVACLAQHTSASREITRFMQQELAAWAQAAGISRKQRAIWDAK